MIESLDIGDFTGGLAFYVNGSGSGNKFSGTEVMRLVNGRVGIGQSNPTALLQVGSATCNGTTWSNGSDRNSKENFQPVNPQDVLDKVVALPLTQWNYKDDQEHILHLGPMAQDFHATFRLGPDDKHIATVDADGVALAAIQGLNQKLEQKETEIAELKQTVNQLKELVQSMNHKLNGGAQ